MNEVTKQEMKLLEATTKLEYDNDDVHLRVILTGVEADFREGQLDETTGNFFQLREGALYMTKRYMLAETLVQVKGTNLYLAGNAYITNDGERWQNVVRVLLDGKVN